MRCGMRLAGSHSFRVSGSLGCRRVAAASATMKYEPRPSSATPLRCDAALALRFIQNLRAQMGDETATVCMHGFSSKMRESPSRHNDISSFFAVDFQLFKPLKSPASPRRLPPLFQPSCQARICTSLRLLASSVRSK